MHQTSECVECGLAAPELSGETTLISKRGWRLRRVPLPNGDLRLEWRCPRCYAALKERDGGASSAKMRAAKPKSEP